MVIIKPLILNGRSEINAGFSTKIGLSRAGSYNYNMSYSVGDDPKIVDENRKSFFNALGVEVENVAYQKQVHGDKITYVNKGGCCGESDAIITDVPGIGLAVSTADCTPILLYDTVNKIIAGIHSGWRSTQKKIIVKTIQKLKNDFNCKPENLLIYIGPSISQKNYEVGFDVAKLFNQNYVAKKDGKYLLDVAGINYNLLIEEGVQKNNIQKSNLCTFESKFLLHSFRREGLSSGRALAVIVMKENYGKI